MCQPSYVASVSSDRVSARWTGEGQNIACATARGSCAWKRSSLAGLKGSRGEAYELVAFLGFAKIAARLQVENIRDTSGIVEAQVDLQSPVNSSLTSDVVAQAGIRHDVVASDIEREQIDGKALAIQQVVLGGVM